MTFGGICGCRFPFGGIIEGTVSIPKCFACSLWRARRLLFSAVLVALWQLIFFVVVVFLLSLSGWFFSVFFVLSSLLIHARNFLARGFKKSIVLWSKQHKYYKQEAGAASADRTSTIDEDQAPTGRPTSNDRRQVHQWWWCLQSFMQESYSSS